MLSKTTVCRIVLVLILFGAASVRFYRPGGSPPGMNVDEAGEIWNAYSLLRTGMDQHGVRWPIFHTKIYGEDDPSTVFLYYLTPFLAVFGLSTVAARIAAAVAGVIGVLLLYYCAARLFGRGTGLVAALLLAFNPWHLFLSRSRHEGILTPLLLLISLAAMLWANFPFDSSDDRPPRPFRAAVAGLLTGCCCYGYGSSRIFLPLFFTAATLLNWKEWRLRLRDREWALATLLMLISAASVFLPLVWASVTDPAMLARAGTQWVWAADDSFGQKIFKTIQRYPPHFGLPFLFESGDRYPALTPPAGYGEFLWFMLPLMVAGMIVLMRSFRTSASARTVTALVLLYPAGDLLNRHPSPHAFRAASGIVALVMVAALGAEWITKWLFSRDRMLAMAAAGLGLAVASASTIIFLHAFFQSYDQEDHIYHSYAVDLIAALDWLRPRLTNIDAVFCTTGAAPHPYMYSLVQLRYEPSQWFNDSPEITELPTRNTILPYEDVTHFGKMYFIYGGSVNATIQSLLSNGRVDRAVFIVKPGELPGFDERMKPSLEIRDPRGNISLLIYEVNL